MGTAALVVLSGRVGGIESVDGVPVVVVWLIRQCVVACVSSIGGTPGGHDA